MGSPFVPLTLLTFTQVTFVVVKMILLSKEKKKQFIGTTMEKDLYYYKGAGQVLGRGRETNLINI